MTRNELESLADLHETEDEVNMKLVLEIMSSMRGVDWEIYLSIWWCRFKPQIEYALNNDIRFGFSYRLMMNIDWCMEFIFENKLDSIHIAQKNYTSFEVNVKSASDEFLIMRMGCTYRLQQNDILEQLEKPFTICKNKIKLQQLINYLKE